MKTKLIKKSIIYTLIGSMLFGGVTPALAGKDYSIGEVTETQEIVENTNSNTTVYAELGSFFKVTIPKHIVLDGTEKKGEYLVTAVGDIAGYETLCIKPDKSFTLSSTNLNDVTATINQDKTTWKFNEMLEDSNILENGTIDAASISAGSWNGNFNFNIKLENNFIDVSAKDENGNDLNASAYNIDGTEKEVLLDSLIEAGMINSTDEVDALIEVESDDFDGLAETTFDVSSIAKEGDKVVILHFDETKQEWEYIGTETVNSNGLITGNFTSYSPVAFVKVNENGNMTHMHNYRVSTINATCEKDGVKTYICACGYKYTENLPKTSHKDTNSDYVCNACGQTTIPAGLYDANGKMLCSWEESGINITLDYNDINIAARAETVISQKYPNTRMIVIPGNISKLGSCSFAQCENITKIIMPDSIQEMGSFVFGNCYKLNTIRLSSNLKEIPDDAFYYCYELTSVTIPDGVTRIGETAFYYAAKQRTLYVTIPSSVTYIGKNAFGTIWYQTKYGLTVRYRGSSSQWNKITFAETIHDGRERTMVYNYTGN